MLGYRELAIQSCSLFILTFLFHLRLETMIKKIFFLLLLLIATAPQARTSLLDTLGINNQEDAVLPVDEAFVFSASVNDNRQVTAHWKVTPGHYLYRDKVRFELTDNTDAAISRLNLPAGKSKMDPEFGRTDVYEIDTEASFIINASPEPQTVTLLAHYQGCSEIAHICYPPVTKQIALDLPLQTVISLADDTDLTPLQLGSDRLEPSSDNLPEQDRIAGLLNKGSLIKILLAFFGFGLLLAFTPCVFPMIPILSSIIIGQGKSITTRRAFFLSVIYVLAMSLTYSIAGVVMGMLGANIQAMFQNPWVIISFSALFVVLALSMFGLFELQLPQFIQNKLNKVSQSQQGGTLIGVALMGVLSALIVGPCLAPPLAGALIFISEQGDAVLGGLALFFLSLGMGIPLIAIGTSAGGLLPKSGKWMNNIKAVFGFMLLGLAIWFLERILPASASQFLWGALLIVAAIYLGALSTLDFHSASGTHKLAKGLGIIVLLYGILYLVAAATGHLSHNRLQPLQGFSMASSSADASNNKHLAFQPTQSLAALEAEFSKPDPRPIMLDFYADWCIECKRMELTTFSESSVQAVLSNYRLLQLDMTDNTAEHKAMAKALNVFGPPTILFFTPSGEELTQHRLVGLVEADVLIQHLKSLPTR